jgi:hypothetical protein
MSVSPRWHVRQRVQHQVADHRGCASVRGRRSNARMRATKHHERERLRQEVVGPVSKRLGLVVLARLGGEHQDRGADALLAQRAADSRSCPAA